MLKEIQIPEIGTVKITKKRGVKRMTLNVKQSSVVTMTIPYSVSFRQAENFIKEKKNWIIRSKKKISEKEDKKTKFSQETIFSTKNHRLIFIQATKNHIIITPDFIKVFFISEDMFQTPEFQEYIHKGIIEALKDEAKEYLPERTYFLANNFNFKYEKVSVRNAKTRWGSCSGKNNISLNIHLMRLPEHLSDYVILHELCHTIEKNHGKKFWTLLDKVSGNAKKLDKELKNYSPSIF
ncbi:MAG: M48 family metallopeptidase [Chlorobi bacterium]|nr:M48 family metallopeptidase [Chlorobiota bacterium]